LGAACLKARSDVEQLLFSLLCSFTAGRTDLVVSTWIAESSKYVEEEYSPTLSLVYLPHLDYCLQKTGQKPDDVATDLNEMDEVVGDLIDFFEARDARVIVLSEYGITPVNKPVHINRALREAGLVAIREELGLELLDCGACKAFAVADHQIAHIYINDPSVYGQVMQILKDLDGLDLVLEDDGKREHHINHERSGDIVCVAQCDAWFTYYYWLDDAVAPDFARCVDIHRKPGYDPVELFVDPEIPFPTAKAGFRIAQGILGFRRLMDLIPLDATLVRGSHGHLTKNSDEGPLFMTKHAELLDGRTALEPTDVFNIILRHLNLDPVE
jgi:predicted AlkP superfamily pyrophosphatase or phosphodiesterase